jgi:hypothetical protein
VAKKRIKSGKVRGWSVHVIAEFHKENHSGIYIERAEFKVNIAKQSDVPSSTELNKSITSWAKETREEGGYVSKFNFGIEKWIAVRY